MVVAAPLGAAMAVAVAAMVAVPLVGAAQAVGWVLAMLPGSSPVQLMHQCGQVGVVFHWALAWLDWALASLQQWLLLLWLFMSRQPQPAMPPAAAVVAAMLNL